MRMLFLSTRLPFPPIGGERLRPFHFIKYLSLHWQITILSFFDTPEEKKASEDYAHNIKGLEIFHLPLPRIKSYIQSLAGSFFPEPIEIAYYRDKQMRLCVERQIRQKHYDLVFCHLLRMAPYVEYMQGIKKVLDLSDALSLRYGISARYRRGPFKLIESLESHRLKRYEPEVARRFDLNIISSATDKNYLEKKLAVSKLDVIENGIEPEEIEQQRAGLNPKKIVFFANLRIFHNVDAVRYFYKEIFPLIRAKIKDARLVVVGANMPDCILQLSRDKAVSVFADVPDVRALVKDAYVAVAPMRISVGIQNKILQSMAYGIPVVATTLGLGGIKAVPGKDVLLADTPRAFSEQVVRIMENPGLREEIIMNAYALIKKNYLWPNICQELNDKLVSLVTN